jgi:hypothetical protein
VTAPEPRLDILVDQGLHVRFVKTPAPRPPGLPAIGEPP